MKEWNQPELMELNICNTEGETEDGTHFDGYYQTKIDANGNVISDPRYKLYSDGSDPWP